MLSWRPRDFLLKAKLSLDLDLDNCRLATVKKFFFVDLPLVKGNQFLSSLSQIKHYCHVLPLKCFQCLSSLVSKTFSRSVLRTRVSRVRSTWHVTISGEETRAGRRVHSVQLEAGHGAGVVTLQQRFSVLLSTHLKTVSRACESVQTMSA